MNRWVKVAALSGALAVALGAFGAHGLKSHVTGEALETWKTAAHYHLIHSAVLLMLGLLSEKLVWSKRLMLVGMCIFAGSLYIYVLSGVKFFAIITPLGGLSLILGWISLALGERRA
ncbi:MAG: DUF423 domain-containing protein [Armatimonadota bacterium]